MEVEVATEVVQAVGLVLKGSVLLGTLQQKSSNSGVMMVNVAWKMLCNKGCGWNESHTTKYHDEHQRLAATFKVPLHIHIGFFWENLTPLPPLLPEY